MDRFFEAKQRHDNHKTQGELAVLQEAHVVGMTTTGVAMSQTLVEALGARIVVVEEAAEVRENTPLSRRHVQSPLPCCLMYSADVWPSVGCLQESIGNDGSVPDLRPSQMKCHQSTSHTWPCRDNHGKADYRTYPPAPPLPVVRTV